MASVSMVSTAATLCCLASGASVSSSRFLFSAGAMAAAFHGAGGRVVPFFVVNAQHSKVLCPSLPHLQQSPWPFLYSSFSCLGTPLKTSSCVRHVFFFPNQSDHSVCSFGADPCPFSFRFNPSFFRSFLFFSSGRVGCVVCCSRACFRVFFFSTWRLA